MFKLTYFTSTFKQLLREPMMMLLFLFPLLLPVIFRLILVFLVPWITSMVPFDITLYHPYILSFVLILTPGMLGIVMGFMLLDDKDGKIVELMRVTPLGRSGYLTLHLSFIFTSTILYTIYTYLVMGLYLVPFITLIYLALLLSIYGSLLGLLLFTLASDKVKGLTYAKALNLLFLFALADLTGIPWISYISALFPTYWIPRMIIEPSSPLILLFGFITHTAWFALIYLQRNRKQD